MMRCKNFCIYFATLLIIAYIFELIFIDFLFPDNTPKYVDVRRIETPLGLLLMLAVNTHSGQTSFNDINIQLFKRFGYLIKQPTYPFLTLEYDSPINITQEMKDFIAIENKPKLKKPPKFLPDNEDLSFLLIKFSALSYEYTNDVKLFKANHSSWMEIEKHIESSPSKVSVELGNTETALSMHHAMKRHNIGNMNGIVLSHIKPLVEVQALQNGARTVYSVGRRVHETSDDRIISMTGVEMAQDNEKYLNKFDFAATFGTLEHLGLGRFGDALDSGADFRWTYLLSTVLKPGGLLFLGLPIGIDAVIFNKHRIYGVVRLPMLMIGFEWIATYEHFNETSIEITDAEMTNAKKFKFVRKTLVLRKL